MADLRDQSTSPMTQSPHLQPSTNHQQSISTRVPPTQPIITWAPIRTDHSTKGYTDRSVERNGGLVAPATPNNPKTNTATDEFPFPRSNTAEGQTIADTNGSAAGSSSAVEGMTQIPISDVLDFAGAPDSPTEGRKKSSMSGVHTPPARRSVQFARSPPNLEQDGPTHSRSGSQVEEAEPSAKDRRGMAIFSKLRALAGTSNISSHTRSQSGFMVGGDSIDERFPTEHFSPDSERDEPRYAPRLDEEGSEIDADAEQSTGDDTAGEPVSRKRRRRSHRPQDGPQTAPVSPRTPSIRDWRPSMFSSNPQTPHDGFRPSFLPRRATITDITREGRQGVSEDEGRDRLSRVSPWQRGLSYGGMRRPNPPPSSEARRPSNLRRALTGLGGSGDRTSSLSAARWRQLKANIKMIGRRRVERTVDQIKSAELLAELTAGAPAALLVASMFQRDEHGNRRIPVLLEQVKVRLTDSRQLDSRSGDRHMVFRIELEYGNGHTRMKWVIHRALRDFANLHARYKLQIGAQKYIQLKGDKDPRTRLPHFPRSTFPYLRGIRGLESDSEEDEEADADVTGPSGAENSGTERPGKRRKRRPSMGVLRRRSSVTGQHDGEAAGSATPVKREPYPEKQRRKLELYLQQMIRYLIFRPESNRLCKFLELSALGVRLAAEGSYHGKEGLLVIQSGKGVDFRRAWTPTLLRSRYGPKWFLVRHSYVVCVDSPEEMNIYDVFLVDPCFQVQTQKKRLRDQKPKDLARTAKEKTSHPQHHSLKLRNSERRLKLLAKNERQLHQFEESMRFMSQNTSWSKPNRFESFAPVRSNVFAQWLVDGRDYMWNVSRAINMAKDVIYIHDWWLSPELYMRRPAAISQKWRLDRLLQRKAQEGVKVFVIVYRNINSAVPIDSEYTKFSLLDLHPNVFVQRSPNQFRQNTFFWAHHEKICIVDHMVAFVGGIDLCFGRWDTPQHTVVDDKLTGFEKSDMPKDADHCQLWPGKDYSNPRVQDFFALDKPYEEMYDRSTIARMPWHDISMQVVGQPARDLTRHFVQRWNYVLRQRKPTRPTPYLLPPPDFNPAELEALGLDGTCEVQILRSCSWWSMGTPDKTECSIMNAYIKMIEQSDHFVYIENQFFISSCEVEGTRIENLIGDALVERIIRASQKGEDWRAVIVIPLMPGFQNTVDSQDGTSIRLIMQCQFRSINRGDASIFGRLRAQGIEPEDYIQFYSLRSWGKIGPNKQLVTEQLYIHAKIMVVDDRCAIIGSANINERSMLGSRDSECAAVVRDTDMLWSTMAGEPYLVGRFPHTLRMRLMREHLGLDVDEIMEEEREADADGKDDQWERDMDKFHSGEGTSQASEADRETEQRLLDSKHTIQDELLLKSETMFSFNHDVDWEQANNPNLKANKKLTEDPRVTGNATHKKDVDGEGPDRFKEIDQSGLGNGRDTKLVDGDKEVLTASVAPEGKVAGAHRKGSVSTKRSPARSTDDVGNAAPPPTPKLPRMTTSQLGLPMLSQLPPLPNMDDTDIGGPSTQHKFSTKFDLLNPLVADMRRPYVDRDCMLDPLNDSFYLDIWQAVADNNTKLFRTVFRCMPDNEVKTWKEYKEYFAYADRFSQAQGGGKSKERMGQEVHGSSGPPGQVALTEKLRLLGTIGEKAAEPSEKTEGLGEKLIHSILPHKRHQVAEHSDHHRLGNVGDWAAEASRVEAERQDKEARRMVAASHGSHGSDEVFDEKTTLRPSTEAGNGFGPLNTTSTLNPEKTPNQAYFGHPENLNIDGSTQKRRRRATTRSSRREFHASDELISHADGEELMKMTQGHLVVWPYDWLAKEEQGGNWLYSIDQLAPLEIYD
ncbi:MAG: phospholipase D [Lasallia pustulata]|uniref:Phospholipase D1 n=1 Tax=Lasallia pustulata TaxID=136370 RepID=A0A5M8PYN3_9LECA|nr:MAG: phospholipase D [Lasallia pustulata]